MPIREELRHFYGPQWFKETRPAALERAGHHCEHCKKPNRAVIETWSEVFKQPGHPTQYTMFWRTPGELPGATWLNRNGIPWRNLLGHPTPFGRVIRVVLCIAHLNHQPGDDRPENLRALCQWCHLIHDLEQHHETRAARKDAGRPLLEELRA